jgi:hypothetical protein
VEEQLFMDDSSLQCLPLGCIDINESLSLVKDFSAVASGDFFCPPRTDVRAYSL